MRHMMCDSDFKAAEAQKLKHRDMMNFSSSSKIRQLRKKIVIINVDKYFSPESWKPYTHIRVWINYSSCINKSAFWGWKKEQIASEKAAAKQTMDEAVSTPQNHFQMHNDNSHALVHSETCLAVNIFHDVVSSWSFFTFSIMILCVIIAAEYEIFTFWNFFPRYPWSWWCHYSICMSL